MNDTKHKNHTTGAIASGSGSAGMRWTMFGARGALMSPEGDGAGGSGKTFIENQSEVVAILVGVEDEGARNRG
jgi:hypothetical protein